MIWRTYERPQSIAKELVARYRERVQCNDKDAELKLLTEIAIALSNAKSETAPVRVEEVPPEPQSRHAIACSKAARGERLTPEDEDAVLLGQI